MNHIIFSRKDCWNYCFSFERVYSKNVVILAPENCEKFCFMALHLLVFGKVRELVGQIKYAFVVGSLSVMTSRSNLDEKSLAQTHAVGHVVTLLYIELRQSSW